MDFSTAAQTPRRRTGPRGSILIMVLIFTGILIGATLTFTSFVQNNDMAIERDIASATALELAEGAAMKTLSTLWVNLQNQTKASASPRRLDPRDLVYWTAVCNTDTNLNRVADSGESGPAEVATAAYNYGWSAFGQANPQITRQVRISSSVCHLDPNYASADIKIEAEARVLPAVLRRPASVDANNVPIDDSPDWVRRKIQMIVRIAPDPSRVFDFAYFANNFGWQYDSGSVIRIFGNMGANGDCAFSGAPYVDGYVFAAVNSDIAAAGNANGQACVKHDLLPAYRSYVNGLADQRKTLMPPTNPAYTEDINANGVLNAGEDANGNGTIDSIPYAAGYDGTNAFYTKQTPLNMPYLGDLGYSKNLAVQNHGKIEQLKAGGNPANAADWDIIVDGVYGSNTSDAGIYSTVDGTGKVTRTAIPAASKLETDAAKQERNGNVALIGTASQPIRVTGPVVITNDLVIKGVISGQGTIYTGRNLHIVGDVTYKNPPVVTQNDPNFTANLAANATKDMVGFAAKGSVILGQYYRMARSDKTPAGGMYDGSDSWSATSSYFKTGFQTPKTQSYQTDPTDVAIGYYNPVTKSFAGDYTASDGGKRYDNAALSTTIARKYYESSFPDQYISSIAQPPSKVQGVFYTNHLFGGRPNNLALFGSMVSRDEGIVFSGYAHFLYDTRSSSAATSSRVNVFTPGAVGYHIWLWQELATTN